MIPRGCEPTSRHRGWSAWVSMAHRARAHTQGLVQSPLDAKGSEARPLPVTDYHEPPESLTTETRDRHRALVSLREEIEAVDWYDQRVALCGDEELKAILAHNRDEEIEHASMTLEWLRRRNPAWDRTLRQYLFTEGPITELEHGAGAGAGSRASSEGLGIGGRSKGPTR